MAGSIWNKACIAAVQTTADYGENVFVSALTIKNFKRIRSTRVPMTPITIVVGGNNSGKSCILQAPHFAINLLQAAVSEADKTIPAHNLRYLPTGDVLDLPHGERLTNDTDPVQVIFELKEDAGSATIRNFSVGFKRGEGLNVKIEASEDELTEDRLSDPAQPYSIYVPGLAGIPLHEEFRSDALIASAIARGDANLYLRNVLFRISKDESKLTRLNRYLRMVMPEADLIIQFDESTDSNIKAWIRRDNRDTPLDAMGTGILQYLQIVAYVIQYRPSLILLDEPDAHLHPNNQRLISELLCELVDQESSQILMATHSRTMLDAFRKIEKASFIWIEQGAVQPNATKEPITMLMELGALDGGEKFYSDSCSAVFLTEDTDLEYLEALLLSNGIDPGKTLIHSYNGSSRLQAALELARFIKSIRPAARVILHRDRDFMLDADIDDFKARLLKNDDWIDIFITEGSDVEHYFTRPEHVASSLNIGLEEAENFIAAVLKDNQTNFTVKYIYKLEELKNQFDRNRSEMRKNKNVVEGKTLLREHAVGKLLLGKLIEATQGSFRDPKSALLAPNQSLFDAELSRIGQQIPQADQEARDHG